MNQFILGGWRIPLAIILLASGCDSYPVDPNDSLQKAKQDKLKVGVIHTPPWVTIEAGKVGGTEVELLAGFAKQLNTEVEWVRGKQDDLMALLEVYELHVVIGGITTDTPWKKHVGLTRAYQKKEVWVCHTMGDPVPENIRDTEVGVRTGSAFAAYVKEKKGIPVFTDSLEAYRGLVAAYEEDIAGLGCNGSGLGIKTEHHVIAVPKGENELLMALERYLHENGY